ncbi:MAG: tetratricopeptide repeat protein [Hyphomicrobiaceae bacterium]|nr:tetratricopeptide repeat protein [Hyphomicrobiaceae bacterium]
MMPPKKQAGSHSRIWLWSIALSVVIAVAGPAVTSAANDVADRLAACQDEAAKATRRLEDCSRVIDDTSVDSEIRVEAMLVRGTVLESLGESQAAVAQYTAAIALDGSNAIAYFNRANVLDQIGQTERALVDYDKAIALDPHDPDFYANRGQVLLETEQVERAIEDFSRALSIGPNELAVLLARAAALEKLARKDGAIADYRKVLSLEPGNSDAKDGLIRLGEK